MTAPLEVTAKRATGDWQAPFLAALRQSGNVRAACLAAGVSRKEAYKWRNRGGPFARAWDEAMDDAIDVLEAVARKRALEISDTLMIFLLKAHRPEKYRETIRQEHSGPDGGPLRFTILLARPDGSSDRALSDGS